MSRKYAPTPGRPAGQRAQRPPDGERRAPSRAAPAGRPDRSTGPSQPPPTSRRAAQPERRRANSGRGRTDEDQQRQPPVRVVRAGQREQPERRQPAQPGQRGDAVADHPGQQADAEQDATAAPLAADRLGNSCAASAARRRRRTARARPGRRRAAPRPPVPAPAAISAAATAAPASTPRDDRTPGAGRRPRRSGHPAGQQQVPAAGVLLAAGDPGGGEQRPHPEQDGEHRAGAPHREPARVVERDGLAEQRPDRRVARPAPPARPRSSRPSCCGSGRRPARTCPRSKRGDDERAAPDLPGREPGDRPAAVAGRAGGTGASRRSRPASP